LSFSQKKNITGPNGHSPVDFAIDLLQSAKTIGVIEVKRKASEIEEGIFVGKVFRITCAKEWYFMECSLDD
jgi:hypothetical protein